MHGRPNGIRQGLRPMGKRLQVRSTPVEIVGPTDEGFLSPPYFGLRRSTFVLRVLVSALVRDNRLELSAGFEYGLEMTRGDGFALVSLFVVALLIGACRSQGLAPLVEDAGDLPDVAAGSRAGSLGFPCRVDGSCGEGSCRTIDVGGATSEQYQVCTMPCSVLDGSRANCSNESQCHVHSDSGAGYCQLSCAHAACPTGLVCVDGGGIPACIQR